MIEFSHVISDAEGLHARPVALLRPPFTHGRAP